MNFCDRFDRMPAADFDFRPIELGQARLGGHVDPNRAVCSRPCRSQWRRMADRMAAPTRCGRWVKVR